MQLPQRGQEDRFPVKMATTCFPTPQLSSANANPLKIVFELNFVLHRAALLFGSQSSSRGWKADYILFIGVTELQWGYQLHSEPDFGVNAH